MSPPPNWARPSLLPEDSSAEPQHTPPEDRVLRRATDLATLRLIEAAATTPVQLAELGAQVVQLRGSVDELRASSGRMEGGLARLVALQERANELRAAELEEARAARQQRDQAATHAREVEAAEKLERARWWRSLAEPRTVGLILIAIVLWLLGQGALIPTLLPARTP